MAAHSISGSRSGGPTPGSTPREAQHDPPDFSGRNLGPVIAADAYLSRIALSHDMARIEIDDTDLRYYVLRPHLRTRLPRQAL